MTYPDSFNQHKGPLDKAFARLLADYRGRVYERYFLAMNDPADGMNEVANPTILVVEDNTDQWFLTRWALLRRFPKAHIHWLEKDTEVIPYLDVCRRQEKDLPCMILVDLYLPGAQEGLNVLQSLKSHSIYKAIPTFTLSWSSDVDDINQAFNRKADGYLIKPTSYQGWVDGLSLLDRYWTVA